MRRPTALVINVRGGIKLLRRSVSGCRPLQGVFRFCKCFNSIGYCMDSHDFDHSESNGTIYFALRHRKRLPQSTWSCQKWYRSQKIIFEMGWFLYRILSISTRQKQWWCQKIEFVSLNRWFRPITVKIAYFREICRFWHIFRQNTPSMKQIRVFTPPLFLSGRNT